MSALSRRLAELDIRTRLDPYEYLEVPAMLLTTLMYAFYFSFARVGEHTVHPTSWPLLWLLFVAFVLFNPLPIFARSARYWLLRNCGRLLTSGVRRVEVSALSAFLEAPVLMTCASSQTSGWGKHTLVICPLESSLIRLLSAHSDQFCSLIFTLSNLYFLGCVYADAAGGDIGTESNSPDPANKPRFGFNEWRHCTTSKPGSVVWGVPIVLAMLPLFVRLVQSVKRWVDSRLLTHLINVRYPCWWDVVCG